MCLHVGVVGSTEFSLLGEEVVWCCFSPGCESALVALWCLGQRTLEMAARPCSVYFALDAAQCQWARASW